MRTRRTAPLFVAAALFCAATLLSPLAARASVISFVAVKYSETGKKIHDQAVLQEADIVGHLTGAKPSTFTKLKQRHQELKAQFADKSSTLDAGERAALTQTLQQHELLLARAEALARKGERLDPRVEAVMSHARDQQPQSPFNALDQVTRQLLAAATATNPAEAGKVFDNLRAYTGSQPQAQAALQAVRVDFASKNEPIVFTDPSSPLYVRANQNRLKTPAAPPSAETKAKTPPRTPAKPTVGAADVQLAAESAYQAFVTKLSLGEAKDFTRQRSDLLVSLTRLAEVAEMRAGRDPTRYTLDQQVAHLMEDDARLGLEMGLGAETDLPHLEKRLLALETRAPDLAAFSESLWQYRLFVQDALSKSLVPTKQDAAAKGLAYRPFKAWELYPQGRGYATIDVEGLTHDGTDYVGMRYNRSDGSSVFQAYAKDAARAIKIERTARGLQDLVRQDFDGSGKVVAQLTEQLDSRGVRVQSQTFDPVTQNVTSITYDSRGKAVRTETGDVKTGEGVIRQLGPGPHFVAKISKNGRREVRFEDDAKAPYRVEVTQTNPDGTIELDFRVLNNGWTLKQVSPHVQKVLNKDNVLTSWEVNAGALATGPGAKHKAAARALAREVFKSIGEPDKSGTKVSALADFLDMNALLLPGMGGTDQEPAIRLSISAEKRKEFTLTLRNKDGSFTLLVGYFGLGTPQPGKAAAESFLVQNEAEYDADRNMKFPYKSLADRDRAASEYQVRAAKVAYEYIGNGARIWRSGVESEMVKPYGDWDPRNLVADKKKVTHHYFTRQTYDAKRRVWVLSQKWEGKADVGEEPGSSPALSLAQGITGVWGVHHILSGSNAVSNYVYTGAVNLVESNISGDLANLNSLATRSRNVSWTRHVAGPEPDGQKDPEKYERWAKKLLAELTPGARKILDDRVMELRPERLAKMGLTPEEAPAYYDKAMQTAPTFLEEYFTLTEFGAGTYGKQLAHSGHGNWAVVVSAGEAVGQMATNPLTWAMPYAFSGLGKFATSMTGKAAVAAEAGATGTARALRFAATAGRFAQGYVGFTVGAPFLLDTAHTTFQAVHTFGTEEGSVKMGEAIVDLAFVYGMARGLRDSAGGDGGMLKKLTDRIRRRNTSTEVPAPVEANIAANNIEVKTVVEPAKPVQLELNFGENPGKPAGPVLETRTDFSGKTPEPSAPKSWTDSFVDKAKHAYDSFFTAKKMLDVDQILGGADTVGKNLADSKLGAQLPADPVHALKVEPNISDAKTSTPGQATKAAADGKAVTEKRAVPKVKAAGERVVDTRIKAEEPRTVEEPALPKEGRQLELAFMKDQLDTKTAKLETTPEESLRRSFRPEETTPKEALPEVKPREFIEKPVKAPTLLNRFLSGGRGALVAQNHFPFTPQPVPHVRSGSPDAAGVVPVQEGDAGPGDETVDEPAPARDEAPGRKDDRRKSPSDRTQSGDAKTDQVAPSPTNNSSSASASSSAGGADAKGEGAKDGAEGHAPKAPKIGGFGDNGGAGGGGGGGGGDGGGAAPSSNGRHESGGASAAPAQAEVAAEPAGNARPAGFASPSVPARRSEVARNSPGVGGGHAPTPTLSHRFDGSPDRPRNAWTPTPMKGMAAGASPALPRIAGRAQPALVQPAATGAAAPADATAGSYAPGSAMQQPAPTGVRPEEEDYSYTYLAPAQHKYEFPADKTPASEDRRYLLSLGLRACAALSVGYLLYHSEIGYLLGINRRRRKPQIGTGDEKDS